MKILAMVFLFVGFYLAVGSLYKKDEVLCKNESGDAIIIERAGIFPWSKCDSSVDQFVSKTKCQNLIEGQLLNGYNCNNIKVGVGL